MIRFSGLALLAGPTCLHNGNYAFRRHGMICARREVEPPCQIPAWELDEMQPIVSTPNAVDKLAALGFKHGWLPMRLRRNQ